MEIIEEGLLENSAVLCDCDTFHCVNCDADCRSDCDRDCNFDDPWR